MYSFRGVLYAETGTDGGTHIMSFEASMAYALGVVGITLAIIIGLGVVGWMKASKK